MIKHHNSSTNRQVTHVNIMRSNKDTGKESDPINTYFYETA